ncbi:AraC family transcriptional regulator [Enterococcus hulanensis]|uniref:AraC family transcriptional regulator n=1 Tax=Enterococcus hulanensis TaxID=2559929 RepID=UPI00289280C8|nr:AraC family transcriptional regulator [Enterococcus hulanensis]MDT2661338.1 AraC family transcriptional regulator [Enterococcus hulanensis]
MSNDPFSKLHAANTEVPQITTYSPIAIFYKQKIGEKVLYTKVQDGEIVAFEDEEYQALHKNQNFELMYVLNGELTNFIEDKEYLFRAGEGCLLNTQILHREILSDGCSVVFLNLSPALLQELFMNDCGKGPIFQFLQQNLQSDSQWKRSYIELTPCLPQQSAGFHIILDSLQLEVATAKIGRTYFQRGLILRLLDALENTNLFSLQQIDLDLSKEAYLVNRVTHLIESRFGNISRKEIEAALHYNAEYLNRLLKRQTKMTIAGYAQMIRTQKAQQLLNTTDLTIQLIAERLGFSSEAYFYHYFKKQTGLSPNQYRQRFKL